MKYWVLVITLLFSLNSFSQIEVKETETFIIKTKQINTFNKKVRFLVSNSNNQPFVNANISVESNISKDVEILYRYKVSEWSKWESTKEDIHLKKEGFVYKEQIYLPQGVKEFEIKGDFENNLTAVHVRFFYPDFTDSFSKKSNNVNVVKSAQSVNCSCPIPNYEARLDWCPSGNCLAQTSPTYTNVTHLIVHHSAGNNTSSDWAAVVRGIWDFHVNDTTRLWSDIGYNYLIDPNGVIYEGRGDNVLGAHFSGMNGGTMGICLLGDYEPSSGNGTPSAIMISKLEELLSWKECDLDIDPLLSSYHNSSSQTLFNISGHRDAGTGTVCPGDNVYNLLPNIRAACSSYMTNCSFATDADLVVSSVSTNPVSFYLGEQVAINYAVGNAGAMDVTDSIKIDLEIDGTLIETNYLNSLNVGNIESFVLPNYLFNSIGNHSICVYISAAANETNVVNNSYCKTINVIEEVVFSDIAVSNIFVNNNQINIGEQAALDFDFTNIGDTSTLETVNGRIKVDNILKQTFTIPVLAVNASFSKSFDTYLNTIGVHEICVEFDSPTNENNVSNNSACEIIEVFPISGIENIANIVSLNIFPNPVKSNLQIQLTLNTAEEVSYSLKNVLGQNLLDLKSEKSKNHNQNLSVDKLATGVYFLNLRIGNETLKKTIIIE